MVAEQHAYACVREISSQAYQDTLGHGSFAIADTAAAKVAAEIAES